MCAEPPQIETVDYDFRTAATTFSHRDAADDDGGYAAIFRQGADVFYKGEYLPTRVNNAAQRIAA